MSKFKIGIVIPCYNVKSQILEVLKNINYSIINHVYLIDDKCPQKTGRYINGVYKNSKLKVIFLKKNRGVGGASKIGFNCALNDKCDLIIKMDGDGQHNPRELKKFIKLFLKNNYCYIKGFRDFTKFRNFFQTPIIRIIGNFILTFFLRIHTKNFQLKDVVNGYFAIPSIVLNKINIRKISNDFFFEQDLILQISRLKFNIYETKIETIYDVSESNLNVNKILIPFFIKHVKLFFKN
jgi:glycosyltransferase involved in cell wall biosynthesis